MKVIAINGSARKDGNTAILIRTVFEELEKENISCEMIQLGGKPVRSCMVCGKCFENKDRKCIINTDPLNECLAKMDEADGIILGSPVYFSNVSGEMKAFIDRAGFVGLANKMFHRKPGAAVVAVRRAGALPTFNAINHFFFINQMIVPGSNYWNLGVGREIGQVKDDQEGLNTMRVLGQNMAWLLKKIGE